MSRAAYGDGSVTQRADGRWQGRWYVTDEGGNRQRHQVYGATKRDANTKMRESMARTAAGGPARDSRSPLGEVIEAWIAGPLADSERAQSTKDAYAAALRNHVVPFTPTGGVPMGQRPVGSLRVSEVTHLLASKRGDGLAGPTLGTIYVALGHVYRSAKLDRLVAVNVMADVERPSLERTEAAHLDQDGVAQLRAALAHDPQMLDLTLLALATGMRRSELVGLTWANVHEDHVNVVQQLTRTSDGVALRPLKGKKRNAGRKVPMTTVAADALRRLRRAQLTAQMQCPPGVWANTDGLVFTMARGEPMEGHEVNRRFRKAVVAAGLDPAVVHPHTLRHSMATFLLAAGVPMKVISEILGHSSMATTERIYVHVTQEMAAAAMANLDTALGQ